MKAVNGKVLVRVDMKQKSHMKMGEVVVQMANLYETNYREKSPVVGVFAETNKFFKEGEIAVFHHNHFYEPSPYYLYDDLFSVPMNHTILGVLGEGGSFRPVFGNMVCEQMEVESEFLIPPEHKTFHVNQYRIIDAGWTNYKNGTIALTRPYSGYEIVYMFNGVQHRVIKVQDEMVCGIVKPPKK